MPEGNTLYSLFGTPSVGTKRSAVTALIGRNGDKFLIDKAIVALVPRRCYNTSCVKDVEVICHFARPSAYC